LRVRVFVSLFQLSFWWKDILKQVDNFRGVSLVKPGLGTETLFSFGKKSGSLITLLSRSNCDSQDYLTLDQAKLFLDGKQ
jgi:hypothetical protein